VKLLVIDLETTGLDPQRDQVLEAAAVYHDTRTCCSAEWHRVVWHPRVKGDAAALAMNQELLERIAEGYDHGAMVIPNRLVGDLLAFVRQHHDGGPLVPAGKNVAGFDLPFLRRYAPGREYANLDLHYRCVDPSMLWIRPDDDAPPSLSECLRRAGLEPTVTHTALDDARQTLRAILAGLAQSGGTT
jgi:oligoribonuclease (3'-5' exoribonuclease)